ncbi:hypothetical protein TYRP_001831 [Tyrophagus putrescentiae]|nr:hypothetical protein TYRP_001831 [Tyrophagus putrescentiae]
MRFKMWFTVKLVETRRSAEQHELHSLRQYVNTLNALAIIGGRARARVNEMVMMVISSCKANQ